MKRRKFIQNVFIGSLGLASYSCSTIKKSKCTPIFKISLGPWSLMRHPFGQADPEGIELFDYPMIAKEMGFDFVQQDILHFPGELPDEKAISHMKKRCEEAEIIIELLLCGARGDVADDDRSKRQSAVNLYKKWIEAAHFMGCDSVRVVCADIITVNYDEKLKYAIEGVSELTEFSASKNLNLLIENHNGYSSDPDWLVSLIQQVNHPRCGILADFTGWAIVKEPLQEYPDPYRGIEILAPYTMSVGAKSDLFDNKGNETKIDYYRMMKTIVEAGFTNFVAVEFFGVDIPRKEGITKTKQLLERVREKLYN